VCRAVAQTGLVIYDPPFNADTVLMRTEGLRWNLISSSQNALASSARGRRGRINNLYCRLAYCDVVVAADAALVAAVARATGRALAVVEVEAEADTELKLPSVAEAKVSRPTLSPLTISVS
jgi:hypothetical protein